MTRRNAFARLSWRICQWVILATFLHIPSQYHRMLCFGSKSCTAFARRGGHVSGKVSSQAVPDRHNKYAVAARHAAARDGGQEGSAGPSGPDTEPGRASLPRVVLRSKPD